MTAAARPPALLPLLLAAISVAAASDSLSPGQPLTTNQSLFSAGGGRFRLGFFSPDDTNRRLYLAIWYNLPRLTAVWVANRDHPLPNSTGSLALTANGTLAVTDGAGTVYWSSSGAANITGPATARLQENGNLVVQDGSRRVIWQSFDHPSDSFLPDMKLGSDYRTGVRRVFTSWLSSDDPAAGNYSIVLDLRGVPQTLLLSSSSTARWRSGPWTGERFNGIPAMSSYASYPLSFEYVSGENETFYSFHSTNSSFISYVRVTPDGFLQRLLWVEGTSSWNQIWYVPGDPCDYVSTCGPFGLCDPSQAFACSCLQGFSPRSPEEWQLRDWKDGCARNTPLDCRNGTDGFAAMEGVKLPDTSNATVDYGMSLDDCRRTCLEDCRCAAYAAANISGGVLAGCIQWTGNLTDLRVYSANSRQDLFLRLAAKDLASSSSSKSKRVWLPILVCALVAAILAGWGRYLFWRKKRRIEDTVHESGDINQNSSADYRDYSVGREMELPLFDFSTIALSTNYFSENNKLGEGGFGLVYKGKLEDGQDVAIKRLGRNSLQGTDEFMNEVKLIAKLQHRNLVRLLGCCIDGEERMLIYEYMANGSLDTFLFDKTSDRLDWDTRYKIIIGIARGLLYLHQDSRFRIIHRDLKASNILLDGDMNPKISDFGMARIFGGDEAAGVNTRRIVGTYGYMSPEYAMDGVFSVKSDVFSFGVLVLEIISGRRNRGTYSTDPQSNLLGLTWSLWNQGKSIEIAEKSVFSSYLISTDVLKCINIGLLCVQARPDDRPTMSSVVFMLGSESASSLPQPKQPGFVMSRVSAETSSSSTFHKMQESWTVNEITVTKTFEGR